MATKRALYDIAEFKAASGDKGEFEALVSIFHNVDVQGDRVVPGAFKNTIAEWRERGDPLPIIWSHSWGDPHAHIGAAHPDDIEETDQGLKLKGRIDLDNPFAKQVYRLLKERRVREFSFGYEIRDEKRGKDGANELLDLGLIEAGPTLKGANPSTELLAVKADLEAAAAEPVEDTVETATDDTVETKAGRRISQSTASELSHSIEGIERELSRLRGLLSSGSDDEEKDEDQTEEKSSIPADGDELTGASDDELLRLKTAIAAAKTRKGFLA